MEDFSAFRSSPAAPKLRKSEKALPGWGPDCPSAERQDPRESAALRAGFQKLLIHKHHTLIAAWVSLDSQLQGRLSYFQFCAACRDLGYYGSTREVWTAFDQDRQGFISLYELDKPQARLLEGFAISVWAACGTAQDAWDQHFNRRGLGRCTPEAFALGCNEIGFAGDVDAVYVALNRDQCTTSIGAEHFELLNLWFGSKKKADKISAFHQHVDAETAAVRAAAAAHAKPTANKRVAGAREVTPKDKFKRLLIKSFGNYVRAWREGLDRDRNGRLDYEEFRMCCADIGYPGPRKEVWDLMDANGSGEVSLGELDHATADMLESFYAAVMDRYISWEEAWATLFDKKNIDRVEIQDFRDGCLILGWGGNVDRLFENLDTERVRYLSFFSCAWIAGGEAPDQSPLWEEAGDFKITGCFKKVTKSQQRRLDHLAREDRLRQRKFETRARGEITAHPIRESGPMSPKSPLSWTDPGTKSSFGAMSDSMSPSSGRFQHSAVRYIKSPLAPQPPRPPPPAAPCSQFRHRLNNKGHQVPWRKVDEGLSRSRSLPTITKAFDSTLSDAGLPQFLSEAVH